MPSSATASARRIQRSSPVRTLVRVGYVANGVVHGMLGVLVLVVAFGGGAQADQGGAFQSLAQTPAGATLIWALVGGLWALGLWHGVQAFLARGADTAERVRRIAKEAAEAIAFLAVGGIGASVALGSRPQGDESAQQTSGGILGLPGGPLILGLAGVVVAGIGAGFVVAGVRRSFRKKLALPSGAPGRAIVALGVAGYAAKGVAVGIVGVLLIVAAVRVDPSAAGGLDGAITALVAMPAGPLLGVLVGAGLLAYGLFTVIRAKYARLDA